MSGTSLRERYVWTVTRQLPVDTGPDVARELRVTLDETIEDKVAAGASPQEAERAALAELGDPDVLAREYGGRPNHLIGPDFYPSWVRVVRVMLAIVLPLAVAGTLIAQLAATDRSLGQVFGEVVGVAFQVVVQLMFWVTVVFYLVERQASASEQRRFLEEWTPEQLREHDVPWRRANTREMVPELAFTGAFIALVLWQFGGVGERAVQVLDPGLALEWKILVIVLLVLDLLVTLLAWRAGRWTMPIAVANVGVNALTAVLWLSLLLSGRLLTDLSAEVGGDFGRDVAWSLSVPVVATVVVLVCAWDATASVLRARGAARWDSTRPGDGAGSPQ